MPNVPTIAPGPDDTEHTPEGATETIPLITNVHADKQSERTNDTAEISDEEAYAKLKAKRAERRRKKLIRRGIAAGIVGVIALIAIVATLVINAQPQGDSGPATDMVTEGTFSTTVEAKGQLKPISSSVVSPSVDGTVDSINVQAGQSVNEGDVLMTIKNEELDRNVAEAQRAVAAAQEDLANAKKAAAAAQANPTTDVDGGSAAAGISAASADTNAVSAAQRSLTSAQANLGPELGQHRGAQRQGGRHGNRRHDHGRKRYERRQAVHADRRPVQDEGDGSGGRKGYRQNCRGPKRQRGLSRVSRYREPGHRHGYRLGGKLRLLLRERRQCDL